MFSRTKSYKSQYPICKIDINDLVKLVKNNPQKDLIDELRNSVYKSKEYNSLKSKLNCITPHGVFSKIENSGLISLSGYLYYDMDNFDTDYELNDTINKLKDTFPISFLQKSVSNKGIHFLIKYDTIINPNDTIFKANDTFILIYSYVRQKLIDKGFNIDINAGGLSRRMIISSDSSVYFNNEVSLGLNQVSLDKFKESLSKNQSNKRIYVIKPNDTIENEIISIDELKKQIKFRIEYDGDIDGLYKIEKMDFHYIGLPKIIKDGTKHKLYTRIINGLYYINNNINRTQIFSYLYFINENFATPKMDIKELNWLVKSVCNKIENTGEIKVKTRTKKIHFNKESGLDKNQKMKMGASINGKLRKNETIKKIKEAKNYLIENNIEPTQNKVKEVTGLSISTIKRNWNLDYVSLEVEIPEKETKIKTISKNDFFKKEYEEINFKGYKKVMIEKVTDEDKKLFISKIREFRDIDLEPCEDIFIKLNLWSEEKTCYLYNKWRKTNPYKNIEYK